jgi:hypothetical protein
VGFAEVRAIALDCPDPVALAGFYRDLTGWEITSIEPDWVVLSNGGAIKVCFQTAPGYAPPTWPDPASSQQLHLDFTVEDLDDAEKQVLALGATRYDFQPEPDSFRVYADPVGHPFCLCV